MSRRPKGTHPEEGKAVILRDAAGRATFLDPFGDISFLPPADVHENASGVFIRLELPGVRSCDLSVSVEGMTIEVVGDKRQDSCGPDVSFLCLERAFGKFRRTFELTGSLNMGLVKAQLKEGVLVLCIPKCEERRGRKRQIRVEAEEI